MFKCKVQLLLQGALHTKKCSECYMRARKMALAEELLTQRAWQINQQHHAPSPYFMAKLAARIRSEAEPYALTWEHAVPALRGWVLTFSAAAILLLVAAFTLNFSSAPLEEQVFAASSNESTQSDAFWMGDE